MLGILCDVVRDLIKRLGNLYNDIRDLALYIRELIELLGILVIMLGIFV